MIKKEYIIAGLIALAVLSISNLPLAVQSLTKNNDLVFLGRRVINSEDVYTYVSFIEQSRQGAVLFKNLYTSEPQAPSLLRPSYLIIGKVAQATGMSSIVAYHAARVVLSIVFFVILWQFLSNFFEDKNKRLVAYALALTASGIGVFVERWLSQSIDLWMPEAITFLALFEAPHFILSLILLLAGYHFFLKYLSSRKPSPLAWSMIIFFILSVEHPFDIVVVVPTLFLTAVLGRVPLGKAVGISVASGIGLIYQIIATHQNPILHSWQLQNLLPSPTPINYLTGFGFLLIFALIGIETFLKDQTTERRLVLTWIGVTALLLYAPVSFQRRFIEGIHIPLTIVATYGVFTVLEKYKKTTAHALLAIFLVVLSLSSFYMVYKDTKEIQTDTKDYYYYHLSKPEMEGIKWLGSQTGPNDIILANWYFGNLIPGLTARMVYLGHKVQTTDFDKKIQQTNQFLLETDDEAGRSFLKNAGITYIYLGINDSILGYGFKPDTKPYLAKVYTNKGVNIYRVKN